MSRIDSGRKDRGKTDRQYRHTQAFQKLEYNFIAKVPSNMTHWNVS